MVQPIKRGDVAAKDQLFERNGQIAVSRDQILATVAGKSQPVGPGNTCSSRADWLSTVTGRVGMAFDRALVYVDGGWAAVHENYSNPFSFTIPGIPPITGVDSASETRNGWTIGAGIEYALSGPWSVKLEYNYIGLGTRDLTFTDPAGGGYTENVRQYLNEVKVGINYRFGLPNAVSTRY